MKIKYFLLIISLAVSFCFVDFGSALAVTSTFSGDSVYPLDIKTPIYSLTISADINLKSDKSLVRVVLLDSKGAERIVYETYPLIADSNTFSIINACGETCVLNSVTPVSLKIQIVDATLNIKSVNSSGTALRGGTNQNQEASNIAKINAMIQRKGLNWTAGKTSVSGLSYEQKKKLFTNPDGTPVSELPNLQGFEYYKGGIFTVSAPSAQRSDATPAVSSGLPSSWDWRNVNGENWNTSVKDQGSAGTCWAHALMGTLEAQINLYYNQHLNLNLSEQQIVDCINEAASPYGMNQSNFQGCFGNNMCYPGYGYCSIGQHGIADESCDPYAATYDSRGQWPTHCDATYVCSDWQKRVWKNASFWDYKFVKDFGTQGCPTQTMNLSEGDFKKILISKGPLNSGYTPWNHAMVLVGYNTDGSTGETTWIYKNSWGSNFGENGYARIKATLADIGWGSLPIGPFTPPTNHAYWPAGFDGTIKCVDKDKDGYCNWGISEQKPSTCPSSCKPQKDCDDSNPKLGPFDVNFNCVAPPPTVTIVNPSVTANWSIGSSYPITWTSSRVSAVSVSLVNSNGVATPVSKMSIPTSIQNGLQWIVPATVTPGNYMLKVSDTDTGYTNISASLAITITVVSTRPTLSFTYPTVGAQLIQGKTYDIGWSSTGMNNAIISLVSGPSMNTISASAPMSSGKYTWTVPTTATVGSNYTIQIINKDAGSYENLSFSSPVFSIVAPAVYCGTLTLDAETNLCVEKPVADFLNSSFRTRIHTCDNCTNLPQLSISVDNGTQSAPLEVYLNNKKLLDWLAPRIDGSLNVLSNLNNAYNATSKKVTGTNNISYLVNGQVKFPSRDESLISNQTTSFRYNIAKKIGKYGSAYFFVLGDSIINMDSAMDTFDSIAQKESSLAGLSTPDPYYVMAWPYMIGGVFGLEGNFYFGDHVVSVSYDIEGVDNAYQSTLAKEISHEYTHNLQMTNHLSPSAGFLSEGMADAVAIFSGFRSWTDVSFGDTLPPGCNSNEKHNLGRCLFKHLDQAGYSTARFFQKLFNPNPTDTFTGLYSCTNKFTEPDCVRDLTKLLNFATGKDMASFIQKDLQNSSTPPTAIVAAPTCTYTYSDWSVCSSGGIQNRTYTSSPSICQGSPITSQNCTYQTPTCVIFSYSAWSACVNGQQTRTVVSSSPAGCTGGSPALSQGCAIPAVYHSADYNHDGAISSTELLRVISYSNAGEYHCDSSTPDGYAPGAGSHACPSHSADYNNDWKIDFDELSQVIILKNAGHYHVDATEKSGFGPGAATSSNLSQNNVASISDALEGLMVQLQVLVNK